MFFIALQRKHERIPITHVSSQTISIAMSNIGVAVKTILRLLIRKNNFANSVLWPLTLLYAE